MSLRTIISNGDLVQTEPTWFGYGPRRPRRNFSDEVRRLQTLEDDLKSKYMKLSYQRIIAEANVADELETLKIILMEKSGAYFESDIDNSILEKRPDVKYKFNRGNSNNNQGKGSSNKDNQKQKQQQQQKKQNNAKAVSFLELLTRAKITIH